MANIVTYADENREYVVFADAQDEPRYVYHPSAEVRQELFNLGGRGLTYILFGYYVDKYINSEPIDYSDAAVAEELGVTPRRIKNARLRLTHAGWFYRTTFRNHTGHKLTVVYLGKIAVSNFKNSTTSEVTLTSEPF